MTDRWPPAPAADIERLEINADGASVYVILTWPNGTTQRGVVSFLAPAVARTNLPERSE